MLTSRKALMSNLNFVHLQHVSLGVHLSMHPEVTDAPSNQETFMKYGCQHKWRDTTEVDQNSNDPSVPCQCCDLHTELEASLHYSSLEDLDTIIHDECLSPDGLPLSPLSLSSPSTDSSSSSDFTLEDSPASMYYKEYSQDGLDTPDQQPDIIPLDVALEGPLSPRSNTILSENSSETNNNMEAEDTPFIDWSSTLDSNSNTLIERSVSSSLDSDTTAEPEVQTNKAGEKYSRDHEEQDLLPGLLGNASTLTPKKTITSFHELALRRRRSGGLPPSQVKRDRSDWLIVFSPDNEQPPMNELTASAFYHGIPELQTPQLSAAKEVTTFREMRYRNSLNKLSVQQMNVHEERPNKTSTRSTAEPSSMEAVWGTAKEPNHSQILLTTKPEVDHSHDQRQGPPHSKNMDRRTDDANIPSQSGHAESILVDTLPAIEEKDARREVKTANKVTPEQTWIRGMADGGDHRGQEVSNLRPVYLYSLMSPHCSARPSGPAQLPWYPGFPSRLSPLGASSPPHRALLTLLDLPDRAILQSPMFPRKRTYLRITRGGEARGQALTDPPDTAAVWELFMADETKDSSEKKSLLIAVGSSVEKIISHFNMSRNQVQKAQLGDSRLSPVLGYLILNHLCPSLSSLFGDGLKPYQKDVIVGRRRLSPWSLVEASTKTGPEVIHLLYSKVSRLPQLRDPQRKFNAFIFGLLNMKQLDVWVLHLHQIYDQLSTFYLPSGFLPLAATLRFEFRDELLLSLQPLSALTFHTDLLFEHHHLSLQDLPTPHRVHSPRYVSDHWAVPSLQNILDLGGWITHNLTWNAGNKAPTPDKGKPVDSPGDKCPENVPQPGTSSVDTSSSGRVTNKETSPGVTPSRDMTSNWWGHLSQASRIYIPANRETLNLPSLKKLTSWIPMDKELNQRASSSNKRDFPEQSLTQEMTSVGDPQSTASGNEQQKQQVDTENDNLGASEGTTCSAGAEPVLTAMDGGTGKHPNSQEKGNWLGQLFGASTGHGREMEAGTSKSRRPSSWLPPNVNVWNLIRKQSTPVKPDFFSHEEEEPRQRDSSSSQRSVRALCDHAASGEAHLSFKKGDVLQLLDTVDEDWIQCRHKNDTGLVPVGYTSLIL